MFLISEDVIITVAIAFVLIVDMIVINIIINESVAAIAMRIINRLTLDV